jgi:hypothetical protein
LFSLVFIFFLFEFNFILFPFSFHFISLFLFSNENNIHQITFIYQFFLDMDQKKKKIEKWKEKKGIHQYNIHQIIFIRFRHQ